MAELTHPISIEQEAKIRSILQLDANTELPDAVVESYDIIRRAASKIGCFVSDDLLIMAIVLAKSAPAESPTSFLDIAKDLSHDDRILVLFRRQWRWARFIRVDEADRKIVATIEDDAADERKFQPTSVRLPNREELQFIGVV